MTFPDEPSPSLHPHYRDFITTTRRSASRRGDGTQPSRFLPLRRSLLPSPNLDRDAIHTRLPTFPTKAADHVHAAFMPDTAWPIHGHPPDSSWIRSTNPVLMSFLYSRHVNNGRLRGPHLTHHVRRVHIAHHDGR